MTIPKNNRIYEYNNEKVIVSAIDIFFKVYLRTLINEGNSEYKTVNWWNFVLNAKYIDKIKKNKVY